jgi:hypothetical protein
MPNKSWQNGLQPMDPPDILMRLEHTLRLPRGKINLEQFLLTLFCCIAAKLRVGCFKEKAKNSEGHGRRQK